MTAEPPADRVTAANNPLLDLFVRTRGTAEGRAEALRRYAFAVPDPTALDAVQAWAPNGVVEIGAGTGYWAASLATRGVDIVAYDPAPASTGANQWFHRGEGWFPVRERDHRAVDAHGDRCLLLVWPTKNEDWPGDAVERFHEAGGERVAFVGEGPGGGTGDDRFHAMTGQLDRCNQCTYGLVDSPCVCDVAQLYTVERRVTIPTWQGFADELLLLQRRTRTPRPPRRRRWGRR